MFDSFKGYVFGIIFEGVNNTFLSNIFLRIILRLLLPTFLPHLKETIENKSASALLIHKEKMVERILSF